MNATGLIGSKSFSGQLGRKMEVSDEKTANSNIWLFIFLADS